MHNIMNNSYLLVDLDQICRNAQTILSALPGGVQLIPVLKDDAYGLGLEAVGRRLAQMEPIGLLAVSHVSEGVALRRAGIQKDILILGGVPSFLLPAAVEHNLTVTVGRLGMVPLLAQHAAARSTPVSVHLKIETGLHRIGLTPGAELDALMSELHEAAPHIRIGGVFSHFADLSDQSRTRTQHRTFLDGVEQLTRGGFPAPMLHLTASAASEYAPEYLLDGTRIGRRLYMDHPTKPLGNIREVASWRTCVTHVRDLKAGQCVGYGGRYTLEHDARIATIGVGYGDGLNEHLCRVHAPVLVGGRRCPLIECCMDQAFVDVTGIDCRPDDTVTLFGWDEQGNFLSSQEISLLIGDNEGCGLTSALTPRVARIYLPQ